MNVLRPILIFGLFRFDSEALKTSKLFSAAHFISASTFRTDWRAMQLKDAHRFVQ